MRYFIMIIIVILTANEGAAGDQWVTLSGGYTGYNLGEVTDYQGTYQGFILDPGSMDSGAAYGLSFGSDVGSQLSIALAYTWSEAKTNGYSEDRTLSATMPLHRLKVEIGYYFWEPTRFRFSGSIGVGAGFINGEVKASRAGWFGGSTGDLESACFVAEGWLNGEFQLVGKLSLFTGIGYRNSRFDKLEISGRPLQYGRTNEIVEFDYSGFEAKAGIKLFIPSSKGVI